MPIVDEGDEDLPNGRTNKNNEKDVSTIAGSWSTAASLEQNGYRSAVTFGLLHLLEHKLLEAIPNAPTLRFPLGPTDQLTVAGYFAAAIDNGDEPAFAAVMKWLKGEMKRGPREKNWIAILQSFAETRRAIAPILARVRKVKLENGPADRNHRARQTQIIWAEHSSIVERIRRAGITNNRRDESNSATNLAADIVGAEHRVEPGYVQKQWYRRKREIFAGLSIPT
jgi:hypothetical protein